MASRERVCERGYETLAGHSPILIKSYGKVVTRVTRAEIECERGNETLGEHPPILTKLYPRVVSTGVAGGSRDEIVDNFNHGEACCHGIAASADLLLMPVCRYYWLLPWFVAANAELLGCFRCAYLLAPLVYSFGWYILAARCLRVYAMCSYRDMALFDSAVLSPPISSVLLLWGCVSLYTAIAPLASCFVRSLVGCPMLEGPLSWWMSEMFFEFEAWRNFWIQKEGSCDFKILHKSPVLLLFFLPWEAIGCLVLVRLCLALVLLLVSKLFAFLGYGGGFGGG
ncbi:hypothetical protein U1Q18_023089 [Sarracenia purpurea var. burkii]